MKVIIPAAGLGSRMRPISRYIPKELLPVWDRPAICYAISEAIDAGATDVVIVSSPSKASMFAQVVEGMENIEIAIQEQPDGLSNAILIGAGDCSEDIGVILPDEYIPGGLRRLVSSGAHVLVAEIPEYARHSYGMVSDDDGVVVEMIEKPAGRCELKHGIIGRYILPSGLVSMMRACSLDMAIDRYCKRSEFRSELWDGVRYDMGQRPGWMCACIHAALISGEMAPEQVEAVCHR